jgi:hypothetical protein
MEDIRSIYFFKKQEEEKKRDLITLLEADLAYKMRNPEKTDPDKGSLTDPDKGSLTDPNKGSLLVKIFIASHGALEEEREVVRNFIREKNDDFFQKNIYFKPIFWELIDKGNSTEKKQDEFNKLLLDSEIVIYLTWDSIGHYTEEEFKIGYESMKEGKKPYRIYLFNKKNSQQVSDLSLEGMQAYRDIQDLLRKEGKIIVDYAENEKLKKEISLLLDYVDKERQSLLK